MSIVRAPDVKLVAFWPAASGCGVESIAVRFGPSDSTPFVVRATSETEPRLLALAGYVGVAVVRESPAEGAHGARERVCLSHLRRAPIPAAARV